MLGYYDDHQYNPGGDSRGASTISRLPVYYDNGGGGSRTRTTATRELSPSRSYGRGAVGVSGGASGSYSRAQTTYDYASVGSRGSSRGLEADSYGSSRAHETDSYGSSRAVLQGGYVSSAASSHVRPRDESPNDYGRVVRVVSGGSGGSYSRAPANGRAEDVGYESVYRETASLGSRGGHRAHEVDSYGSSRTHAGTVVQGGYVSSNAASDHGRIMVNQDVGRSDSYDRVVGISSGGGSYSRVPSNSRADGGGYTSRYSETTSVGSHGGHRAHEVDAYGSTRAHEVDAYGSTRAHAGAVVQGGYVSSNAASDHGRMIVSREISSGDNYGRSVGGSSGGNYIRVPVNSRADVDYETSYHDNTSVVSRVSNRAHAGNAYGNARAHDVYGSSNTAANHGRYSGGLDSGSVAVNPWGDAMVASGGTGNGMMPTPVTNNRQMAGSGMGYGARGGGATNGNIMSSMKQLSPMNTTESKLAMNILNAVLTSGSSQGSNRDNQDYRPAAKMIRMDRGGGKGDRVRTHSSSMNPPPARKFPSRWTESAQSQRGSLTGLSSPPGGQMIHNYQQKGRFRQGQGRVNNNRQRQRPDGKDNKRPVNNNKGRSTSSGGAKDGKGTPAKGKGTPATPSPQKSKNVKGGVKGTDGKQGDQKNAKGDQKNAKGDQKNAKGDQKNAKGDQKNVEGDQKNVEGDQKNAKGDQKNVKSDQRNAKGGQRNAKPDDVPAAALRCHMCNLNTFNHLQGYLNHLATKNHRENAELFHQKGAYILALLRADAKLASQRNTIKQRKIAKKVRLPGQFITCYKCQCEVFGFQQEHNKTLEHQLVKKFINSKCCGFRFPSHVDREEHRLTVPHLKRQYEHEQRKKAVEEIKEKKKNEAVEEGLRLVRGRGIPKLVKKLATQVTSLKNKHIHHNASWNIKTLQQLQPYDPSHATGLDYIGTMPEFHCKVCPDSDGPTEGTIDGVEQHCRSVEHYKLLLAHLANNPGKSALPESEKRQWKPPSALSMYLHKHRQQIKEENPNMSKFEVNEEGKKLWDKLDENEKKEWLDKAEEAKKAFEAKKAESKASSDKDDEKPMKKETEKQEEEAKKEGNEEKGGDDKETVAENKKGSDVELITLDDDEEMDDDDDLDKVGKEGGDAELVLLDEEMGDEEVDEGNKEDGDVEMLDEEMGDAGPEEANEGEGDVEADAVDEEVGEEQVENEVADEEMGDVEEVGEELDTLEEVGEEAVDKEGGDAGV